MPGRIADSFKEYAVVTGAVAAVFGLALLVLLATGSAIVAVFLALLLGFPLMLRGNWGFVGFVAVMALSLSSGASLGEYLRVSGGELGEVTLAEAGRRPEFVRLAVADARLDAGAAIEAPHVHRHRNTSTTYVHAIAPVVASDWQPGDRVHVYAACFDPEADHGCHTAWKRPTDVLIRVDDSEEDCYRGLLPESAGEVTFVRWHDPDRYLAMQWSRWTSKVRYTALGWLVLGALVAVYLAIRER